MIPTFLGSARRRRWTPNTFDDGIAQRRSELHPSRPVLRDEQQPEPRGPTPGRRPPPGLTDEARHPHVTRRPRASCREYDYRPITAPPLTDVGAGGDRRGRGG